MSQALLKSKPLKPSFLATSQTAHQSALACLGESKNARCREIRRSELVTVPSFSPHPNAGSKTSAYAVVSVWAQISEITTNSHFSNARLTWSASGKLTTGLVAIIQTALIFPLSMA